MPLGDEGPDRGLEFKPPALLESSATVTSGDPEVPFSVPLVPEMTVLRAVQSGSWTTLQCHRWSVYATLHTGFRPSV